MQIPSGKNIFFISDFHLGAPNYVASLEREKIIVQFLEEIKNDAAELFIVGDMFDFWYEYRQVVPKGYVRLLGKLAELSDAGIPMHFFVGNHDMWMKDYFIKELNIPVYYKAKEFERNGKKFLIGHGDGLGPGDHGYKRLKKIFRSPACQWLFGILPPVMGMGLANYLSRRSRIKTGSSEEIFLGEEKEWLITYCKEVLHQKHIDFFVFGHRHLPIDYRLSPLTTQLKETGAEVSPRSTPWRGAGGEFSPLSTQLKETGAEVSPLSTPWRGAGGEVPRYINLGDWIRYYTYAVFDGNDIVLKSFKGYESKIIRN